MENQFEKLKESVREVSIFNIEMNNPHVLVLCPECFTQTLTDAIDSCDTCEKWLCPSCSYNNKKEIHGLTYTVEYPTWCKECYAKN